MNFILAFSLRLVLLNILFQRRFENRLFLHSAWPERISACSSVQELPDRRILGWLPSVRHGHTSAHFSRTTGTSGEPEPSHRQPPLPAAPLLPSTAERWACFCHKQKITRKTWQNRSYLNLLLSQKFDRCDKKLHLELLHRVCVCALALGFEN